MKRIATLLLAATLLTPAPAFAGKGRMVFHATKRAVASKVVRSGRLSMRHARGKARFGKGAYFATSKAGARREAGTKASLTAARIRKTASKRLIDTRRMSKAQLKRYSGIKSLRGTVKKGVIGPKLGRRLGRQAGRDGKALLYRPVAGKGKHANLVVPERVYRRKLVTTRLRPAPKGR